MDCCRKRRSTKLQIEHSIAAVKIAYFTLRKSNLASQRIFCTIAGDDFKSSVKVRGVNPRLHAWIFAVVGLSS